MGAPSAHLTYKTVCSTLLLLLLLLLKVIAASTAAAAACVIRVLLGHCSRINLDGDTRPRLAYTHTYWLCCLLLPAPNCCTAGCIPAPC
jgi:hypothetical protein